jgi:transposase-like protein
MKHDNVIKLEKPETIIKDLLTEILQKGSRRLLAAAVEAEIEGCIDFYKDLKDDLGRQRIIRNGYNPEREIQTGIGQIKVKVPRSRDRQPDGEPIRFTSSILPPYLRRTRSIEELLPWLYLKGISTGDFKDTLEALLGKDAPGLSANTISRLKVKWIADMEQWNKRKLIDKHYVYFWADGLYCNVRMAEKQCLLVIIGVTESGRKELVAIEDGFRESELSWMSVLRNLKERGLSEGPRLAIGDGALGFWKAIAQIYPETQWQRCWVHKTANVLNKLPKSLQSKAKEHIHDIWMAPGIEEAEKNFDVFIETYEAKYPKSAECLEKDRDVLLNFYSYPAEHWKHIRTSNPIESTFATVRLRTKKVRNCFSSQTVVTMAFQLCRCAEKRWQKINAVKKLAKIIEGVQFVDGVERIAA